MVNRSKVLLIFTLLFLGALGLTKVAVSAQDNVWPWSSEPGTQTGLVNLPGSVGSEFEDSQFSQNNNPFEPNDQGAPSQALEIENFDAVPSLEDEVESTFDWSFLQNEPQPDNNHSDASLNDTDPRWSVNNYYFNVAGSALTARDSNVDWKSDTSGGCLYLTNGDLYTKFNIHLDIPNGARIEYLRVYYYSNSSSNSYAWITRYNNQGAFEDVAFVKTTPFTGYGTELSSFIGHVVDSVYYSYVLIWQSDEIGATTQLCGLRVAYRLP